MKDLHDQNGWIYLCMDIKNANACKLGMTTRALYERITETGNPDYMIIKAYKVPPEEALDLERHLKKELGKSYQRKEHFITGKLSEWFCCSPPQAAAAIEYDLAKCLGLQDEDGNPTLSDIIFKPHLGPSNELLVAERVNDSQHYYNLVNALIAS